MIDSKALANGLAEKIMISDDPDLAKLRPGFVARYAIKKRRRSGIRRFIIRSTLNKPNSCK